MWRRYCDALNLISPNAASDVGSISSRYACRSALARSISDSARIGARLCFAISTKLSKSSQSSRVASIKLHIGNFPKSRLKNADVLGCSADARERASKQSSAAGKDQRIFPLTVATQGGLMMDIGYVCQSPTYRALLTNSTCCISSREVRFPRQLKGPAKRRLY
jgi:hypothetical protein